MKTCFAIAVTALIACGCGVKGDPVAPGTPAELGRGLPTYKRATEEFAFPDVPPTSYEDEQDKQDKQDETGR